MKLFFFFFFSFCTTLQALSQATLSGYVTLQNSKGESAFPAQVKAWGATATTVNSEDGSFTLVFDRKQPGDDASLEIIKDGYEVVNRENLLEVRLPLSSDLKRPLKFYLCPKGQWQQYADQFYKINLTGIKKSYESKLKALKKKYRSAKRQNEDYQQAKAKLDEELKVAEAQAQELAEKFAKANLDDASERFKLAYRLFSEGKIDSVLIVLKEEELLKDLEIALTEIQEGAWLDSIGKAKVENGLKSIGSSIGILSIRGQIKGWEDAEAVFKTFLARDSVSPVTLEAFGNFILERIEKDTNYLLLNAASDLLDLAERAVTAINLSPEVKEYLNEKTKIWFEKVEYILQSFPEASELQERKAILKKKLND